MKSMIKITAVAAALALAACSGGSEDAVAENVEEAAEIQADNLDAMADNATTEAAEQSLENQADAVEQAGEEQADRIEENDAGVESNVSGM